MLVGLQGATWAVAEFPLIGLLAATAVVALRTAAWYEWFAALSLIVLHPAAALARQTSTSGSPEIWASCAASEMCARSCSG